MAANTVSILSGNAFVVSDARGDMDATPLANHGLFANDTRFLSRWILTINGMRPAPLSKDESEYFKVQFFLALTTGTIYVDSKLSVVRRRRIGRGFQEEVVLVNHDNASVELELRIEADADFADLFEVKDQLAKKGERYRNAADGGVVLGYKREKFWRETRIRSSKAAELVGDSLVYRVQLAPHAEWSTTIHVDCVALPEAPRERELTSQWRAASDGDLEQSVQRWLEQAPRLECTSPALSRIYRRSLIDLAALRFRNPFCPGALPAAGLPWFMAVFGRDSLLTSFQALPYFPELAAATLETLALFQGRIEDPFRDEEPGKILHELRLGELTAFEERPHSPYYGAADSTCLFLILLEEYDRWTGDHRLAKALEREARAAVEWIDRFGDRDADGYIEYERRNTATGLDNQCWKDSWDSIAFADGTLAPTPRATCELQGYAYDAKRRTARLARDTWNDPGWAAKLEREAEELKARFNRDFWLPERRHFALGLDGRKRKIDSLTSNIGHLLWSGIVQQDKADDVVSHLMGDALYSGWGVRTMAVGEGSYNPIGYHVGTVWPHDNSLIAWGLAQYGYREEAARIAVGILEAAALFEDRLPEAFAGYERGRTKYPVEYPTACSPQAWATGAPLLLLRTLLGLDSDGRHLLVDPAVPEPLGRIALLDLSGPWGKIDAFGRGRPMRAFARESEEGAFLRH
jgi:glycogen debranching enzyme